ITLWDREQLQQNIAVRPDIGTELTVTTSDTIDEKSKRLDVNGELKLSLLAGNVQISGAARYFNDTKKSFKQERLMLHYRSSTKFEHLTMNHLAHERMDHHEVFDYDIATHVVTAVRYGADAYFVFDRQVNEFEKEISKGGEVKINHEQLKKVFVSGDAHINIDENDEEKVELKKLSCTFYGDFKLPSNPATFEDAMKVYTDLPKLIGENGEHAVPVKVWLFPLVKLDSSAGKLQRFINTDLIRAVESVFEALNVTYMKCSDLMQDTVAKTFSTFYDQVQHFQKFCSEYKQDFMRKLAVLLPEIRGGKTDIKHLTELLDAHHKSPFNAPDLQQWITVKEKKSNQIKALLKQLCDLGAEVTDDIGTYLLDLNVEVLVAYAFTCIEHQDPFLTKQEIYLNPSTVGNLSENTLDPSFQEKSWTLAELACKRNNLQIFSDLIALNKSQTTKFIVQSVAKTSSASCIQLYENGCNVVFCPPSKPTSPTIESVTDDSITLKSSPSCSATLEINLLYKMEQEKNWKTHPANKDTITDLQQGTAYEMKYEAKGKLNYTVESDVTTATTSKCELIQQVVGITADEVRSKMKNWFTLGGNSNKPPNKHPNQDTTANQMLMHRHKKYFTVVIGNTFARDVGLERKFEEFIEGLQKVQKLEECDFILVFCLFDSQCGTDIEPALNMLSGLPANKPAVVLVLHHTSDPITIVPDSRGAVNRGNTITVDLLFCKDKGLVERFENDEALSEVINWINLEGITNMGPRQSQTDEHITNQLVKNPHPKHFTLVTGNTLGHHVAIERKLQELIPGLQKVQNLDDCDFILVFCPVVSCAGTDIEAAVRKLNTLPGITADDVRSKMKNWFTLRGNSNKPPNKHPNQDTTANQMLMHRHKKYFTVVIGNTFARDVGLERKFEEFIEGLQKVQKLEECDFILVFCLFDSQCGTDIEPALNMLSGLPANKPAVVLVLHHTSDPITIVPDSRGAVNRGNTITVDLLFCKDKGLVERFENDEALSEVINWINLEGITNMGPRQSQTHEHITNQLVKNPHPKHFTLVTGNTLGHHVAIERKLQELIPGLQKVQNLDDCDFILVFCPASCAGTDIEAAVRKLNTLPGNRPTVLVMLHHTFDPEYVAPDSSRRANRENTVTVDCLFYEDQGLLQCFKNDEALSKVINWLQSEMSSGDMGTPHRAGISVASAPCLTALSGALPFRPPTPPYVPATAGQRGLTIPTSTVPQGSSNPNINPTDPGSSSPSSPVTNSSSGGRASLSHGPVQVISRAGRQHQAVSLVTFSCHLSSEISAADKEVLWFRNTRCVCLYKKGQNIEGRGYEGRVSLFTEELKKGNVSLRLKDFTESDLGQYHCKVIDGDRTEELTLGVLIITDIDSPQVFISQIDREWTKEENTIMEESALLTEYKAVNERLEQVKEMENNLGEKKKELDERNKHLSERDAALKDINGELKNAMEQIKEKNTQLDNLNKQLNEKETQVKTTDEELETSKNKLETLGHVLQNNQTHLQNMMIVLEEKKTELSETNKQLEEQKRLLTERETQLTDRDKTLQENAKLLTENAQTLQMKDKTLEERDILLKQAKVELDKTVTELKNSQQLIEEQSTELKNTNKLLSETETQLKDRDKELETSRNKLETLKQELQDKTDELQKMLTILEQQKTELGENRQHLAEKERRLTKREAQLMDNEKQLQEKDTLLTENAQKLQLKDKTLEEKDTKLSDINSKLQDMTEKLQVSQRQLEEKERQVAETHKELETSKNQLEIMGRELQDKNRQINEMTNLLEQQKTEKELADKDKQVERDKQTHPDSSVPVKKRNSIEGLPPYMGAESSTSLSRPVPELRLVLLGRMSSGKCAARNIILGSEMNQAATFTSTQQSESTQGEVAGRMVTVVDTPDWFSPGLCLEELRQDMGLCVRLSAPGPHAFLLVIPVKQPTGEESGMLEILEQNLGERCWRNTMILFTITDELQRENIEEFIQSGDPELQRLGGKCENRFHCLNIKESGDGSQVSELMEKIEEMVEGREKFYSSEIYLETESQIRAMETKILKEREEKRISQEREMREKLEKEVQDSLRKIEGELEEIREVYEGEAKMEAEQNLMKIIMPELQRNILASKTKMQEEFSRQMEEKNRELENLKQKFSNLRETHILLEEVYEKTDSIEMAAASNNEFKLISHQEKQAQLGSAVTFACCLSPEISAVNMEIRWFKGTDCVCLYKNRQMTEGRGYKGRVSLFPEELERGNVSLQLRESRESDIGHYLCRVTDGERTERLTVRLWWHPLRSLRRLLQCGVIPNVIMQQWGRKWTEEEKMRMEESSLLTEHNMDVKTIIKELLKTHADLEKTEQQLKKTKLDLERATRELEDGTDLYLSGSIPELEAPV
ncbi:calponin homology domain-containing protein DDB_G0272472-like isoform X3, partial [Clarias magur]